MGQQTSGIRTQARHSSLTLAILLGLTITSLSAQGQTFTVLHAFTGSPDGMQPTSLLEVNGTLYGTTLFGGRYGFGTIFKVSSQGKESVLYSFTGGKDGANPTELVPDNKGNVYGVAQGGGNSSCRITGLTGCGVIFKISSNKLTVLYTFSGGTDGALPQQVVVGPSGDLYGVAEFGGDLSCIAGNGYGCGVVFKLNLSGTETVLYTFSNFVDGILPVGLIMDSAGNLFGTTALGGGGGLTCNGGYGCGVVFEIKTTGAEVALYTFTGAADGGSPNAGLLIDSKRNLYGTASIGGDLSCVGISSGGCGVVFKVSAAGVETVLHTFSGPDGANPGAGLMASMGEAYGETSAGGAGTFGVLFVLSTDGEKVLYNFKGSTDGEYPQSGLIMDSVGNLYGTASSGGDLSCNPPYGCGTVFRLAP